MVRLTTGSTPPGTACSTRKTIMLCRFQATPHSADPAAKPTSDSM
jgi:hypothetical protein